jgi:hypothetical protein
MSAKTTLLCAIKFSASAGFGPTVAGRSTLRAFPRKVARSQGFTPAELNTAERELVREGLLTKPRKGAIALTSRGISRAAGACRGVSLSPWDGSIASRPRRMR